MSQFSFTAVSQRLPNSIAIHFIKESYRIAKILQIPIRPNIYKDSSLIIIVDKTIPKGILNCAFITGNTDDVIGDMLDTFRYYLKPKIIISNDEYRLLCKNIDTPRKIYFKAASILLHEMIHYLQITNVRNENYYTPEATDSLSMNKYCSQPIEFEAYSVQAYFFLKNFNHRKWKEIIKTESPLFLLEKVLINEFYKEIYPWRKGKIFLTD